MKARYVRLPGARRGLAAVKRLVVILLAVAFLRPAFGCDLCAIYSAIEAQGKAGSGFYGGIAEQYTSMETLQNSGHEVANRVNQFIHSSVSQIFAGYNFNDRIGVQFNLPVIYREFQRPRGPVVEHGTEFGLGDASLIGNLVPYQKYKKHYSFSWSVLGGIKFPTGNASHLAEEDVESENGLPESGIGGHDVALGSGSFDGIVGTSLFGRWEHLFASGGMQYALRTEGSFGHQYADDLTWAGGPGVYVILNDDYSLALQGIISGESKGKDTVNGNPDNDSAETIVYAGPQINFTWGGKLSAQAGADFPVHIENSGLQVVPTYRVHAAVTWRF